MQFLLCSVLEVRSYDTATRRCNRAGYSSALATSLACTKKQQRKVVFNHHYGMCKHDPALAIRY